MDMMSYLMGRSAGSKNAKTQVVTELPETGEPNVIYLVPKQTAGQDDIFDEYIWVNEDWELIGSTAIDISGKQDTMQFSTMPTADSTTVGKIIQYTGTTTNDYTNGYFYIGTTDGTNYGWDRIDVQPGVEASNIAVCTIIGKNIGTIQVQPQNNGVVNLSGGAQTELTTFLNNHLGKYIILQLIGNNDANCIIYLGYLQTTTSSNIQIFPKYIYYWVQGSTAGAIFYGATKVMYSYNATTNKYSIGFYENPLDGKPQPIATQKYVDDNKGQTIQYSTMPTASANTVGQIVQYTGTTDSTYTNGYFYVGVADGTSYSWVGLDVQDLSKYLNNDEIIAYKTLGFQPSINTNGSISLNGTGTAAAVVSAINKHVDKEPFTLHFTDSYGNHALMFVPRINKEYSNNISYQVPFLYLGAPDRGANIVFGGNRLRLNFNSTTGYVSSVSSISTSTYGTKQIPKVDEVLTKTNTDSYTPTADYHPATKKYVDDAIGGALNGSY